MKNPYLFARVLAVGMMAAVFAGSANAAVFLPASAALPTNSVSNPGFVVRTAQASTNYAVANNFNRALRQINGLLTDSGGSTITNIAIPGTNSLGAYHTELVDFERDAFPVDIRDADGNTIFALFGSELFPGIPGEELETSQFATEVITLVVLPAGTNTLAISTAADRTDVNDDDGYSLFVGANPRDYFAMKVADFQRAGAAPFSGNQNVENLIEVVAPVAGAYPFRILHWQQTRGTSLHFYTADTNTAIRLLVNDPFDSTALRAYRNSTSAAFNSPYVAEVSPVPGSAGNGAAAAVEATLLDGTATVVLGSVQLSVNGSPVTPQVLTKNGNRTTVQFAPSGAWTLANNTVKLVYTDSAAASHTNTWSFEVNLSGGSATRVTGQWDFDFGDLRPTVGNALQYFDPTFDGPGGSSGNKTAFGTCTDLGVPTINGQEAVVMQVPGDLDRRIGYVMSHGISPNGGGTRVNQYTLIMDVLVSPGGAAALLQTSSLNNTDDGDLFWQGNNFGQGTGGYNGYGTFTPSEWHRMAVAYDLAANPPVVTKYVDGIKQDDWIYTTGTNLAHSLDAPRRALQPTAILFGDGDQDERHTLWVNSIQIRAGKLSDAEMVALGGPDARGIPQSIPQSTVAGQWDFNGGDLRPTIGEALRYFDPTFDGPTGTNANLTQFGSCSALGQPLINGEDANIMQVPGDLTRNIGYVMTHRIAPNGGGTRVNQYTLIMDILMSPGGAAALLQTSSLNNSDDGDLFWQGNNVGQGTGGYNGYGTFTPGEWHRMAVAYDLAANPPVVTKYVDGIKQDDWIYTTGTNLAHSLDAPRRAMQPTAILFGDGDQDERHTLWVNSIQVRSGKLSDAEMVLLGGPSAAGIPVVLPSSTVAGQWDFNGGDLRSTIGKALAYFDPSFDGPTGTNANLTQFGTCSALGQPLIGAADELIMQVPGDLVRNVGYVMTHGIAPNGGGTRVNEYTLIMDLLVSPGGAASLLQTSSLNNTDDGDLFWQGNNIGQGTGGYNGTGQFTAAEWHRMAIAYNLAASPPVVTKYVDGIFQDDWIYTTGTNLAHSLDAPRRALQPTAILFGDGDQDERHTIWANSIQIRSGALSKPELAALGAPAAGGIPVHIAVETGPAISIGMVNQQFVLNWALSATGYTLESASDIASGNWSPVSGVANNSKVVPLTAGNQFFRLKK